jgi:hypothetical protein
LVAGVALVTYAGTDTSKIAVATVTAIGSALSGYIAATYLTLNRQAADQLKYFADQPLITSYVYEAERLVRRLPPPNQESAYRQVLGELLRLTERAQNESLADMRAHRPKTEAASKDQANQ